MGEITEKKADEVFCFSCGEIIKQEAEICPKCGIRQKPYDQRQMAGKTEIYCHSCGERINAEAEICPKCGVRQQVAENTVNSIKNGIGYFTGVLKKYAVFSGRARRAEFWWYILGVLIIDAVVSWIGGGLFHSAALRNIISLAFIIPSVAVGWRRMHDVGKCGAYGFIPIYGIILAAKAGDKGSNKYGPDPKEL
ncbi:hypothetical protein FACS189468_9290 [Spirochaetia bacterium]|nr:hypothetical protein FACS189468_9290 [Spirochaetia bacterium]